MSHDFSSVSPFVKRPLDPVPLGLRLVGLPAMSNAAIELENLLAEGKGGVGQVSRVLRPYGLGGSEVRQLLNQAYIKALVHCLSDDRINDEEHLFLKDLRRRLDLSDNEVAEIHQSTLHPRYEQALAEVLADARITADEREALRRLEVSLRLPEETRKRIHARVSGAVLQKSYEAALSDRRLSPEEETDLKAMAENLGVAPNLSEGSRVVMERYRLLWRIENGDIPAAPAEIKLQMGETCYFQGPAQWWELRTAKGESEDAAGAGIPIVKGVRFRLEIPMPSVPRNHKLTQVDSGTLYITNKRLLFTGASNNRTIRLGKVSGFEVFAEAIVVEKDAGRRPYLFIQGDVELAAVVLSVVLEKA
jgi:hypothetical protein